MRDISIQPMTVSEVEACCGLVERVFMRNVAPLYSEEGVLEFMKYCNAPEMVGRMELGAITITAKSDGRIVGLTQLIGASHISLFFVETGLHGKGIGRRLFQAILESIHQTNPELKELTVNSSPNSYSVYERLGFKPAGEETTVHGIRHMPMVYQL